MTCIHTPVRRNPVLVAALNATCKRERTAAQAPNPNSGARAERPGGADHATARIECLHLVGLVTNVVDRNRGFEAGPGAGGHGKERGRASAGQHPPRKDSGGAVPTRVRSEEGR